MPSGFKYRLQKCKWDLITILALWISYVVIYLDVVLAPYLIIGVDFLIPSLSPLIPWDGFYNAWSEYSLGFPYGIGWTVYGALLNGFFVLISGNSLILSQKFMFMGMFFASTFMYIFLIKHITKLRSVAFLGALMYAYGPSTVNYGTGIVWELAFFPLVLYYVFNILSSRPNLRDAAFLALSLDFIVGYGLHVVFFLPIIFITFLLLNLRMVVDKFSYLINTLKFISIGIIFFLLSNIPLLLTIVSILNLPYLLPAQYQVATLISSVSIDQFYLNYGSIPFLSWFTESYGLVRSTIPLLGYLFPILAFMSLVISKSKQSRKLTLGFSFIFIIMLLLIVMVVQKSNTFIWLYNNFPPIRLLRGLEGVLFLTTFLIATLITLTVNELIEKDPKCKKKVIGVSFVMLLLFSFFMYVSTFLPEEHINGQGYTNSPNNRPVEIPIIYNLIVNWMEEKGAAGSFRYLLLPSPLSSSNVLSKWYPYQYAPVHGLPLANQYVSYSLSALLSGQIDQWGRLLAPAGVKYIFVVWNTTESNFGGGASTSLVEGKPNIQAYSRPCGSYEYYIELLRTQKDIKLIVNASNYLLYENLDYIPHVSIYSSLAYVIGDLNVINTLAKFPNFQINDTLLAFSDQQIDALNYATSVIFDNRGVYDLLLNGVMKTYTIPIENQGKSHRDMIRTSWVQATIDQNYITERGIPNSGLLTSKGFIETTGDCEIIASFSVQNDGLYQIWLCAMYAPVTTGYLHYLIDGHAINLTIHTHSKIFEGFEWIDIGTFELNRGTHTLGIINSNGYSAITRLGIVPKITMEQAIANLSQVLATKHLLYILNSANHNIELKIKAVNTMTTMVYLPTATNYYMGYFPSVSINNSVLLVDDEVIPLRLLSNNWVESSIVHLLNGYHNITIIFPYTQIPEVLTISTENLKQATNYIPHYNVTNMGNSEYIIDFEGRTKPIYVMLSEAYSDGWFAYADESELPHLIVYSFLNGYYTNGTNSMKIRYDGQRYLTLIWISLFIFSGTLLIGIVDYYIEKFQKVDAI